MVKNVSLGSKIVAEELLVQRLLANSKIVGGVFTMGFDDCLILTNDLWKKRAGGIPQHCFLLATAMAPGESPDIEDEEIILLRVVGPAQLPAEAELVQVRTEAMREMLTSRGSDAVASPPAILDVLTRNEIQFSGVRAKILGTFYEGDWEGTPFLAFGSDVETFYSSSRYKVYKPVGQSLAIIASFPEISEEELRATSGEIRPPNRVRVGTVRYSSSNRRRKLNMGTQETVAVPVKVNISDFVSLKTAVFGMTRLGKSNTMKTIATSVFQHSAETGQKIGQLLFDPAGEYANVNVQDQTALAAIGPEFVTIFRFGADGKEPGVRPLTSNFFSEKTIGVTWAIIAAALRNETSNYIKSFLAADVIGPADEQDDYSAFARAARRRAALYATLTKANFSMPDNFGIGLKVNKDILAAIKNHSPQDSEIRLTDADQKGKIVLTKATLKEFWDGLLEAQSANENLKDWIDPELEAILTFYKGSTGSGYKLLDPLRIYHSSNREDDYADEVLQELREGKIVIVDLSRGSESVLQFSSERIINHIVFHASNRFKSGNDADLIQIFIEEAHRLFNRDRMKMPDEADPYVRLAKEAAKFRIGLIYATQEVSSVDSLILSNTSNWIVTHLNNHDEVRQLSNYYDFKDFAELTLKSGGRGLRANKDTKRPIHNPGSDRSI